VDFSTADQIFPPIFGRTRDPDPRVLSRPPSLLLDCLVVKPSKRNIDPVGVGDRIGSENG